MDEGKNDDMVVGAFQELPLLDVVTSPSETEIAQKSESCGDHASETILLKQVKLGPPDIDRRKLAGHGRVHPRPRRPNEFKGDVLGLEKYFKGLQR